jgi:hypothetical protein
MEMMVNCSRGHLPPLDSARCYMIVNDTAKVPLHVSELVTGDSALHSYSFYCNARFSNIKTMRLVTGNDLLDGTLKNIAFNRRAGSSSTWQGRVIKRLAGEHKKVRFFWVYARLICAVSKR